MRHGPGSLLRRIIGVTFAGIIAATVLTAAPVAAAPPSVTYGLSIGSCTISGEAPPDILMRLVHQDAAGHRLGGTDVQVEADGDWTVPCLPGGPIQSGHRLVAKQGSTTLRTLVVPRLSIDLDRATDVLKVRGPAGTKLHVVLDSCIPGYITCYGGMADLFLLTNAYGRYQTTLGIDVRGGDRVRLELDDPVTTDFFERLQFVPYLRVERGSPVAKGSADPNAHVHVQLRRNGTVRATMWDTAAAEGGAVSGRLRRNGRLASVAAGDRIKGDEASDGVLDVMVTRVTVDLAADTAHVTCYPYGRYGVTFTEPGTSTRQSGWGELDQTGRTDVTGLALVQSGWTARLWCASRKGDVVFRRTVIP